MTRRSPWPLVALALAMATALALVPAAGRAQADACSAGVPQPYCQDFKEYRDGPTPLDSRIADALNISKPDETRSIALVIAIDHYPHLSSADVPAAAADAKKLVDFLINSQKFNEVILLQNDQATKENIDYFLTVYLPNRALDFQSSNHDGKARLLIAYTGHGLPQTATTQAGFLLSDATSLTDDPAHIYKMTALESNIQDMAPKFFHVLTLINACYGGSFFTRAMAGGSADEMDKPGAYAIVSGDQVTSVPSLDPARGSLFFDLLISGVQAGVADLDYDNLYGADENGQPIAGVPVVARTGAVHNYLSTLFQKLNDQRKSDAAFQQLSDPWLGPTESDQVAAGGFFFLTSSPGTLSSQPVLAPYAPSSAAGAGPAIAAGGAAPQPAMAHAAAGPPPRFAAGGGPAPMALAAGGHPEAMAHAARPPPRFAAGGGHAPMALAAGGHPEAMARAAGGPRIAMAPAGGGHAPVAGGGANHGDFAPDFIGGGSGGFGLTFSFGGSHPPPPPPIAQQPVTLPAGPISGLKGRPDVKVFKPPWVYPVSGYDLSSADGAIDWAQFAQDQTTQRRKARFIYARAVGWSGADPAFADRWAAAAKLGLDRGAYLKFDFCMSPMAQLSRLRAVAPPDPDALPVSIELVTPTPEMSAAQAACYARSSPAAARDAILALADAIRRAYAKTPILAGNSYNLGVLTDARADSYMLWLYAYLKQPGARHLSGDNPWTLWQFSGDEKVAGIGSQTTKEVFFGTDEQYAAFKQGHGNVGRLAVQ